MEDLLDIPAFLRRVQTPIRRRRPKHTTKPTALKPTAKKWAKALPYIVEVPVDLWPIPPGRRYVFAVIGWKWVDLACRQKRVRIPRQIWNALKTAQVR